MSPISNCLRGSALVLTLAAVIGCTKANPAFRGASRGSDDAGTDELPPPVSLADAAAWGDLPAQEGSPDVAVRDAEATSSPDVSSEPDVQARPPDAPPSPPDAAPPTPDLSLTPPDLAPPPRDTAPDAIGGAVTSALIAYWPFDEGSVATDVVGDNEGTLQRGAVLNTTGFAPTKFANRGSLQLGGVDEYVELTNRSLPPNEGAKTIALWFRAVNPAGMPIRTMVSLANAASQDIGLQIGLDQGRIAIWFFGDLRPMRAGATVDGNWRHAAVTYDGAGQYVLYYEGNAQGDPVPRTPLRGQVVHPRIGTWEQPEEMFHGSIDDVRVYSRALTPTEIGTLAAGQ